MAHYDCSDCGASMGIAYGICKECTPDWYFKKEREDRHLRHEAARQWDVRMDATKEAFILDYIKEHSND